MTQFISYALADKHRHNASRTLRHAGSLPRSTAQTFCAHGMLNFSQGVAIVDTIEVNGRTFNREQLECCSQFLSESHCENICQALGLLQMAGWMLSRLERVEDLPEVVNVAYLLWDVLKFPAEDSPEAIAWNAQHAIGTAVIVHDPADSPFLSRTISRAMTSTCSGNRVLIADGDGDSVALDDVEPATAGMTAALLQEGC